MTSHAEALWRAEHDRAPIAPLTETDPSLTVADAYAIQTINVERRLAAGACVIGRKVGLTSKPMQEMLGVDEPDYGVLRRRHARGGRRRVRPRARCCSRASRPRSRSSSPATWPDPASSAAAAATAVAGALPALEIIDSRVADWRIKLVDTVADNASCGRVVLGGPGDAGGRIRPAR